MRAQVRVPSDIPKDLRVKNVHTGTLGTIVCSYFVGACIRSDVRWDSGGTSYNVPHRVIESIIPLETT